jgi:serine/threonine protein kinase
MILEYCNGLDLNELLCLRGSLTQPEVSMIIKQVCLGAAHLWTKRILHRDLKPSNILLHFPMNPEVAAMTGIEKEAFHL